MGRLRKCLGLHVFGGEAQGRTGPGTCERRQRPAPLPRRERATLNRLRVLKCRSWLAGLQIKNRIHLARRGQPLAGAWPRAGRGGCCGGESCNGW
jgi:hypothetical protein